MRSFSPKILEVYRKSSDTPQGRAKTLLAALKESLLYDPPQKPEELAAMSPEDLKAAITGSLRASIESKRDEIGEEVLNRFIRSSTCATSIPAGRTTWRTSKRFGRRSTCAPTARRTRSSSTSWKGSRSSTTCCTTSRLRIAKKIFRVRIQQAPAQPAAAAHPVAALQASHSAMGQFAAGGSSGTTAVTPGGAPAFGGNGGNGGAQPQPVQVKRTVPKVGRNDLCPCGSGKKYKYCHGK